MSATRWVLLIILAGTALRIGLAATTGLGYDESYMVGNARELTLGYVDHPPLHVWLVGLTARLLGEQPLSVRLPFILLFAGSTWLMFRLTTVLFSVRAGLWAAIAFSLAPVFSVIHATFVLPDGPAIFFLLAAANVVSGILLDTRPLRSPTPWWLAAGALVGLALLSKFNATFFPLAVFGYLLSVPAARRHLATPGPWLAALVAAAILSPAILWNLQHGLVGLSFQAKRVVGTGIQLDSLALQIGGQLLYLSPWLAVPFAVALARALARGPRDPRSWLIALAAVGPIVLFTVVTLWSRGLPHWTMPGWLFAIPLFGRDAAELASRRPQFAQRYMAVPALLFVALFAGVVVQATRGALIPQRYVAAGLDPTVDLIDWTELRGAIAAQGPGMVVAAPNWMIAGKASYALGPSVPVVCVCDDPRHFAFRADRTAGEGRDVVLIAPQADAGAVWNSVGANFDGFQPLPPVTVARAGEPVLTLDLRLARNLHFPAK